MNDSLLEHDEAAIRPVNIHVCFTDGQKMLLDHFFLRTIQDDWIVVPHRLPYSRAADFGSREYAGLLWHKVRTLLDVIFPFENDNDYFIHSDIDIQFFGKCNPIIFATMKKCDIAFQNEFGGAQLIANTGFIAMRRTDEVKDFWIRVERELRSRLKARTFATEQMIVNEFLQDCPIVNWNLFPSAIWLGTNADYSPSIPTFSEILLHHANGTIPHSGKSSLDLKLEQMNFVRDAYNQWSLTGPP